ncbi:MAG: MAPEG family protein [Proteobacteria bacterium]|nr:MAPEG family protein [Pseudomonadota bacterium]
MLIITSLYASILAILVIFLAFKVTSFRRAKSVGLGDDGDKDGMRVIRVHANAIEYIPIILILMGVYEANGAPSLMLHIVGSVAVIARVLHATGLSKSAGKTFGRFAGTFLTWFVILVLSGLNIYNFIAQL